MDTDASSAWEIVVYITTAASPSNYIMRQMLTYGLAYTQNQGSWHYSSCVYDAMQALVINAQKRSVDEMAAICCRQVESDSMLLFLRAIAAAAMAVDDMMELWAQPIREELPTSFK